MSHASHGSNMHDQQGDSDGVNIKKIVTIGVVSLIVFGVGILWAVYLMHNQQQAVRSLGPLNEPKEIYKAEIGIVDNILFTRDTRLKAYREERAAWLNGYGWVDRKAGLIHVPIERAMAEVVREAAMPESAPPLPPPAPSAATPEPPKPAKVSRPKTPAPAKAPMPAEAGQGAPR